MQPMTHDSGAVGIGSQVIANGTRGLAVGTAASAEVTALVPAGADEVSAQAAAAFAKEGMEALALNTFAQTLLGGCMSGCAGMWAHWPLPAAYCQP